MNKNQAKMTVTLSMLFIFAMAMALDPAWVRGARDFVIAKVGGTAPTQPKGASRGGTKVQ